MQFDSLDFYRVHAQRYSRLSHEFTHSVYTGSSHPALRGDLDLLNRVVELAGGIVGWTQGAEREPGTFTCCTRGGMTSTGLTRWRRTSAKGESCTRK